MKRFQFMASVALGLALAGTAPAMAADIILLPGTGDPGDAPLGAPAPRHPVAAVGGAGVPTRGAASAHGAGIGAVNDLFAVGALTRGQAATFRASIQRIAKAEASGRSEVAVRARRTFRALLDRCVRKGSISPGAAQRLIEAV